MADVRIRVIGEDQATRELSKIDSSLGGLKKGLGDLAGLLAKATGAAAVIGVTIKKAFDLGAEGAAVLQTAQSFDLLLQKVGAAPDLLEQLRAASKGTIADMQLMSSTSTLLAGTQGDLATALANSTPQLLEIAKAANKLNPSLGDTTFLYNSLAVGIKRASPLILDNLGLTIKIEEAYSKYALTLGKSAAALTAEEQKMALLNAALDAGNVLIDQVGGNTDSATDSFQKLDAATKNLSDRMKADLEPMLANAATALYDMITWTERLSVVANEHADDVFRTTNSYEAYKTELERAAGAAGFMVDEQGNLVKAGLLGIDALDKIVQKNYLLTEAEFQAAKALEFHTWVQEQDNAAMEKAATATETLQAKINEYAAALTKAGTEGQFGKALDSYTEQMRKLQDQAQDLRVQLAEELAKGFDDTSISVGDLTRKLEENQAQQGKLEAQVKRTTAEIIYQRIASLLDAESALVLASRMGLITEADYELERQLILLTARFDENSDGIIDNAEKTDYLVRMALRLYEQTTQNIGVTEAYTLSLADLTNQEKLAAEEAYRLNAAQNILSAAMSGTMQRVYEDYAVTLGEVNQEYDELIAQYMRMVASGMDPLSSAFDEINKKIADNIQQQFDLKDALRKTTAEMIYQQASQGLSADASLELARSMGLISEKDYKVAMALQQLREMYDANHDGAISASEGAMQYVEAVKRLYQEVTRLMELGLPFDNLMGAFGGGTGGLAAPSGGNNTVQSGGYQFVVNYQPGISFGTSYEFNNMIRPLIEQVLREHNL